MLHIQIVQTYLFFLCAVCFTTLRFKILCTLFAHRGLLLHLRSLADLFDGSGVRLLKRQAANSNKLSTDGCCLKVCFTRTFDMQIKLFKIIYEEANF